ncbi:MAG: ferredoxin [Bacilli bacterium]|mgnify:CR=1 FL=1
MPKKVTLDKDLCISCGVCNAICPQVFDWDDDGKMKTLVDTVPADLVEAAQEAEAACPTGAIRVE